MKICYYNDIDLIIIDSDLASSWRRAWAKGQETEPTLLAISIFWNYCHIHKSDNFLHQFFGASGEIHREPTKNGG